MNTSLKRTVSGLCMATCLFAGITAEAGWETETSGDVRLRGEVWNNFSFLPNLDDEYLQSRIRVRIHSVHEGSGVSLFLEGKSALTTDRELPGGERTLDDDPLALQQAFLKIPLPHGDGHAPSLILGRQELKFGAQRLVSPLGWSNTGRTWDGGRYSSSIAHWQVDAFYTLFVPVDSSDFNDPDSDHPFYGVYATHTTEDENTILDVYALVDETDAADRNTYGTRLKAVRSAITAEIEAAYQDGDSGALDVEAYMFASEISYELPFCPFGSRWGLGYDVSSGDEDAADGESGTFHPLFPLGHAYHGYIDAIGRRNLTDFTQFVAANPTEKVSLRLAHHIFDRTETSDAVYNAGNGVLRPADSSEADSIGTEWDLTCAVAINEKASVEAGYSHFDAGDVIDDSTPNSANVNFVYLSGLLKF